jgi:hypothetical protein
MSFSKGFFVSGMNRRKPITNIVIIAIHLERNASYRETLGLIDWFFAKIEEAIPISFIAHFNLLC